MESRITKVIIIIMVLKMKQESQTKDEKVLIAESNKNKG